MSDRGTLMKISKRKKKTLFKPSVQLVRVDDRRLRKQEGADRKKRRAPFSFLRMENALSLCQQAAGKPPR
jgi:hypothetical protein